MMFYCIVVFYDFRYLWIIYRFIDFKDHVYLYTPRPIYQSTHRPTYRSSVGRHINRCSTDLSVDM